MCQSPCPSCWYICLRSVISRGRRYVLVGATQPISGGHFNPMVSVMMAYWGVIPWSWLPGCDISPRGAWLCTTCCRRTRCSRQCAHGSPPSHAHVMCLKTVVQCICPKGVSLQVCRCAIVWRHARFSYPVSSSARQSQECSCGRRTGSAPGLYSCTSIWCRDRCSVHLDVFGRRHSIRSRWQPQENSVGHGAYDSAADLRIWPCQLNVHQPS
jgi:hypothetical protein